MSDLKSRLNKAMNRTQELWRMNCTQLREFDSLLFGKDEQIAALKLQLNSSSHVSRVDNIAVHATSSSKLLECPPSYSGSIATKR